MKLLELLLRILRLEVWPGRRIWASGRRWPDLPIRCQRRPWSGWAGRTLGYQPYRPSSAPGWAGSLRRQRLSPKCQQLQASVLLLASDTCILGDLSLGDHLLAFRVHQFTVLVLLQTLKDVLALWLSAKTLTQRHFVKGNGEDAHTNHPSDGAAYPDHGLTDFHQLVVQLRVSHLHFLQLENPQVATLSQLFFALLQTLDDLKGQSHQAVGENVASDTGSTLTEMWGEQ